MVKNGKKTVGEKYFSLKYPWIDNIFTHLSIEEKRTLIRLAENCNGLVYVEIGSFFGASACCIAEGIRSAGKKATLYCVDTWQNDAMGDRKRTDTYPEFLLNTQKYSQTIVPLRGTSSEIAGSFEKKIDFLFIDADHTYEGVKGDVDVWFPKLHDGALVIFHDIGWAGGVQQVVREAVVPRAEKEGRLPNLYWARVTGTP
jgi:predicted O-methyltransferase YrrM